MRINTNISAMNAYDNLSKVQNQLSSSMEKLSSGFRINNAGDDAAGLGIANDLRGDIGAMQQASDNADQASSVLQIMDGATQNIESILESMKQLAAQSASDTVDTDARTKISNQFNSLSDELDRIVQTTQFQGANLLDGTFGSKVTAGGSIDATAANSLTSAANVSGVLVTSATALEGINGNITASVVNAGTNTLGTVTGATAAVTNQTVLNTIDPTSALTVSSTFDSTVLSGAGAGTTGDAVVSSAIASGADTTTAAALAAGAYTVSAAVGSDGTHTVLTLTDAGGNAVDTATVADGDASFKLGGITFTTKASVTQADLTAWAGTPQTLNIGQSYDVNVSGGGLTGQAAQTIVDDGTATQTATFSTYGLSLGIATGGEAALAGKTIGLTADKAIQLSGTDTTGASVTQKVTLSATPASQTLAFSNFGVNVVLGANANLTNVTSDLSTDNTITQGSTHQAEFLVSASGNYSGADLIDLDAMSLSAKSLGVDKASVDLTTASGAQSAMTAIDGAITSLGNAIGSIGAAENRISYASSNVKTSIQNYSAAESTIRDVDMASEMTNFSKEQIMAQAGTAMLAQANQMGSSVLKLLQ